MTKDCEISKRSQSLVVLGLALFNGVLAVTPKWFVSSLRGGSRRFESYFAQSIDLLERIRAPALLDRANPWRALLESGDWRGRHMSVIVPCHTDHAW